MARVDLWLDDDDVAAAQTAGQFTFQVPDDCTSRRGNLEDPNDDKAKASWTQKLEVIESKFYEDEAKDKDGHTYPAICAEVQFQVPSDAVRKGLPDPNAGKSHRAWYRVVPAAMKNKQHSKYKANNFNLGRMNSILRGIWGTAVFPHGTKVNLGEFYGGDSPPVVGKTVIANVRASKYEGERKDELTDFIPLELRED